MSGPTVSRIGQPATPLSRTLASIHSSQGSPGLNPREILLTLDRLIGERLWEGETGWDGKPMTLARALVEPWPVGVEMTSSRLERLYALAEDADVDPELVRRVQDGLTASFPIGPAGRHTGLGSPTTGIGGGRQGMTADYLRRRLHRDRPDLYERVLTGDLAVNAAAVEAGIRRPQITVPSDTPGNAMRALLRRFTAGELLRTFSADQLRAALDQEEAPAP